MSKASTFRLGLRGLAFRKKRRFKSCFKSVGRIDSARSGNIHCVACVENFNQSFKLELLLEIEGFN